VELRWGLGFRIKAIELEVRELGIRIRVLGSGFRVGCDELDR